MPEELASAMGHAAERTRLSSRDIVGMAVLLLLCVALYVFFTMVRSVQAEQSRSAERGYRNRAVICDMVKSLGLDESKECSDPAVRPYRDPHTQASSSAGARNSLITMQIVCRMAKTLNIPVPECAGVG